MLTEWMRWILLMRNAQFILVTSCVVFEYLSMSILRYTCFKLNIWFVLFCSFLTHCLWNASWKYNYILRIVKILWSKFLLYLVFLVSTCFRIKMLFSSLLSTKKPSSVNFVTLGINQVHLTLTWHNYRTVMWNKQKRPMLCIKEVQIKNSYVKQ